MSLLLRRRSSGSIESGGAPPPGPTDPNFANVQFLLGFNGTNGATTTTDEGPVGRSFTFTGSAQISTAQQKFGTASLQSAASESKIEATSDTGFQFGTAGWTAEAWVYASSSPANGVIIDRWNNGTGLFNFILYCDGSNRLAWGFRAAGANRFGNDSSALTTGTWHHVALTRDGTAVQLYKNGSRVSSFVIGIGDSADYNSSIPIRVGYFWPGYIDEARVTKGVARYTGTTYTVPTAAFPRS